MASEDSILKALLGGGGAASTSGSADVNAFNRTLRENDYWSKAGNMIGGVKFDDRTWSPGQTLAASAGQAFLSTILDSIGQSQERKQTDIMAQALPELYRNPEEFVAPEGVDSMAVNALKMAAIQKEAERKASLQSELQRQAGTIGGMYDETGKLAEIPGWTDLLSKKAEAQSKMDEGIQTRFTRKMEDEAYKRISALPVYKQLSDVSTNINALPELVKQNTKAADIGLISTIARIRDPESVVREGEIKINQDVQSYLDSALGNWRAAVNGESRLDPKVKRQVVESVLPKYNELVKSYEQGRLPIIETLQRRGGDPLNVPSMTFKPFTMDMFDSSDGSTGESSREQKIAKRAAEILAKLRAGK